MVIEKIGLGFSVCKVDNVPAAALRSEFCFIGKTDEEISLVCPSEDVPDEVIERDDGWRVFRIQGILDFSLVGVLAEVAGLLSDNEISIFAISTYNTDYILTKADKYAAALDVLEKAGYRVV